MVKGTPLVITAEVEEVAGGRPGATRYGPVRSVAAAKWWPSWPAPYAYPHGGPPSRVSRGLGALGSHPRMRQSAQ